VKVGVDQVDEEVDLLSELEPAKRLLSITEESSWEAENAHHYRCLECVELSNLKVHTRHLGAASMRQVDCLLIVP
jgi:hypothetical protein